MIWHSTACSTWHVTKIWQLWWLQVSDHVLVNFRPKVNSIGENLGHLLDLLKIASKHNVFHKYVHSTFKLGLTFSCNSIIYMIRLAIKIKKLGTKISHNNIAMSHILWNTADSVTLCYTHVMMHDATRHNRSQ